jgi:hypothetical protein
MGRLGLPASGGGVYFGQLLGMADALTFTLGQNGCVSSAAARLFDTRRNLTPPLPRITY